MLCTDLCSMAMELLAQIVDLTVCIIVVSSNNGLIMKYFIINFDVGKVKERLLQRTFELFLFKVLIRDIFKKRFSYFTNFFYPIKCRFTNRIKSL